MAARLTELFTKRRVIPVLVAGNAVLGAEYCDINLTACCTTNSGSGSGSGSGTQSGNSSGGGGIAVSGCDYTYPTTIHGTWTTGNGTCGCFTGSFTLTWTGTNWTGLFTGCGPTVTVVVTPPLTSMGNWTISITSPSYSFSTLTTYPFSCGFFFSTTSITVTGACSGATQLTITL